MACVKHKYEDDNNRPLSNCKKPAELALDGIIVVCRYNPNIDAECMALSVNNCIQAPFFTGYTLRMSHLDIS